MTERRRLTRRICFVRTVPTAGGEHLSVSVDATEPLSEESHGEAEFKSRATSGAQWVALQYGGGQVIRLLANLILTRMLFEEYFGLMALVSVVMIGIQLFSDIGIQAALIQNEREDRSFVDTIWTIAVGRGVMLFVVASILAGPAAAFYGEPILGPLIRFAGISAVLEGLTSTNYHTANRHLLIGRIILIEMGAAIFGAAVMILWASLSPSVWALAAGGVASSLATMASSWFLPGPRNRFHFERGAAQTLYHFGRWIFVSTLLTFLVLNADRLIFGKLIPIGLLGIYNIALALATMPSMVMLKLSNSILFPIYSRFHREGANMLPLYRNARMPTLVLGGWATAGLLAGGQVGIQIMYDSRYWEAGWILQVIAVGYWFGEGLECSNGGALIAFGKTRSLAFVSSVKVVAMAVLIPLGWQLWGFKGAMAGFVASDLLRYLTSVAAVVGLGLDARRQDAAMSLRVFVSAGAAWASVELLKRMGSTNLYLHALVIALVVTAFWVPLGRALWRRYKSTGQLFFAEET